MNNNKQKWFIFFLILIILLLISILIIFNYPNNNTNIKTNNNQEKLIGGDKDQGGCLIAAGYSWCEIKNKCLRIWEEPCISEKNQNLIETYLKNNITELSPTKEVLGGKFYITNFRFTDDKTVTIDYEDGHIALQANITYFIQDEQVIIDKFLLSELNGYDPEIGNSNSAVEELTSLFSQKYNIDKNNISITINDDRGDYLRGGVKFSKDQDAPGGYFLAKIVDGKYEIVTDGNGQIDCALVSDFPDGMTDDCVKQ